MVNGNGNASLNTRSSLVDQANIALTRLGGMKGVPAPLLARMKAAVLEKLFEDDFEGFLEECDAINRELIKLAQEKEAREAPAPARPTPDPDCVNQLHRAYREALRSGTDAAVRRAWLARQDYCRCDCGCCREKEAAYRAEEAKANGVNAGDEEIAKYILDATRALGKRAAERFGIPVAIQGRSHIVGRDGKTRIPLELPFEPYGIDRGGPVAAEEFRCFIANGLKAIQDEVKAKFGRNFLLSCEIDENLGAPGKSAEEPVDLDRCIELASALFHDIADLVGVEIPEGMQAPETDQLAALQEAFAKYKAAIESAQVLPREDDAEDLDARDLVLDLRHEAYREYVRPGALTESGEDEIVARIEEPIKLGIHRNGFTHRILGSDGIVTIVDGPAGGNFVRSKPKSLDNPFGFRPSKK